MTVVRTFWKASVSFNLLQNYKIIYLIVANQQRSKDHKMFKCHFFQVRNKIISNILRLQLNLFSSYKWLAYHLMDQTINRQDSSVTSLLNRLFELCTLQKRSKRLQICCIPNEVSVLPERRWDINTELDFFEFWMNCRKSLKEKSFIWNEKTKVWWEKPSWSDKTTWLERNPPSFLSSWVLKSFSWASTYFLPLVYRRDCRFHCKWLFRNLFESHSASEKHFMSLLKNL